MRKRSAVGKAAEGQVSGGLVCPECGGKFDPADARVIDGGVECPRCMGHVPVAEPKLSTVCADCGTQQRSTPSGATCELGHGGADGISKEAWEAKLQAAKDRAKPSNGAVNGTAATSERAQATEVPKRDETMRRAALGAPIAVDLGCEVVSATRGAETYSIRQFNSFHVGPFSGTTVVRQGESRADALRRLSDDLAEHAAKEFDRQSLEHAKRLERLGILRSKGAES